MKKTFKIINTDRIFPHPMNPRAELGDITDLANSIAESGIQQPLVVVPGRYTNKKYDKDDAGYTIIAGHRRFAAARKAGLTEVPCIISDVPKTADQIALMVTENVQRRNLTPMDEIKAVEQMMIEGFTEDEISRKTGIKKPGVKKRAALAPVIKDAAVCKKAEEGVQITFSELEAVSEIDDEEKRNELIGAIGTKEFDQKRSNILYSIEKEKKIADLKAEFERCGFEEIERDSDAPRKYLRWVTSADQIKNTAERYPDKKKYYRIYELSGGADVFIEAEEIRKTEEEIAEDRERAVREIERVEKLDMIAERAYIHRHAFIKNFSDFAEKSGAVMRIAAQALTLGDNFIFDEMLDIYDIELPDDEEIQDEIYGNEGRMWQGLDNCYNDDPWRFLLWAAYNSMGDNGKARYHTYRGERRDNFSLDFTYKQLESLGYEMNEEEEMYVNGKGWMWEEDTDDGEDH